MTSAAGGFSLTNLAPSHSDRRQMQLSLSAQRISCVPRGVHSPGDFPGFSHYETCLQPTCVADITVGSQCLMTYAPKPRRWRKLLQLELRLHHQMDLLCS